MGSRIPPGKSRAASEAALTVAPKAKKTLSPVTAAGRVRFSCATAGAAEVIASDAWNRLPEYYT